MLIAFVVVAVAAPLIAPYDPGSTDVLNKLQSPSWEHLVGTDGLAVTCSRAWCRIEARPRHRARFGDHRR
ncbi:MAG: hypothetical protein R2705_05035 [Ilumatobacteraceae bacterium]